jgi:glutathione S-transferase
LEPRVGGRYKIIMHLPDGRDFVTVGEIKAYDPPRMFSMSWGAEGAEDLSLLTVSLRDVGGKTELTLRHEGFPDAAMRDLHQEGWSTALNKLRAHVARPV